MSADVIDFRVQPPFSSFGSTHFFRARDPDPDARTATPFVLGREPTPSFDEFSMDLFRAEMLDAGVSHAVVMGQSAHENYGSADNDDITALMRMCDGELTGFAGLDAAQPDAMLEFEAAIAGGCRGVSLITGWSRRPHHEDDVMVRPILEECARRGIPVVFTSSHYIGRDISWSQPQYLQRVAMSHPALTIIVGHGCWPWAAAACALAMQCPNVYLMPEFYLYLPGMPGARDYIDAANGYLAHRMLYSSCYPSRPLTQARAEFEALPISAKSKELIQYENAARLLFG